MPKTKTKSKAGESKTMTALQTSGDGAGQKTAAKDGGVDLHSMVWLMNNADGEHGPYFVMKDYGQEIVVMRHYVSETPGGKFSQWATPMRIDKDYCILKPQEKRPRLYCQSGWDWFLNEYANSVMKHCTPITTPRLKKPFSG